LNLRCKMNEITTDGSLIGKRGGWAVIIRGERTKDVGGSFYCEDSYDAELMAIYNACKLAEDDFMLVSDHKGIVNDLNNMIFSESTLPEKNRELWQQVKHEANGKLKGAVWLKRHTTPELRQAHKIASGYASNYMG